MSAAACALLGLAHLLLWLKNRQAVVFLLSSIMAFSAGFSAMLELAMSLADSLENYTALLRLENLVIYLILVPMTWFVYISFGTAKRWLAIAITVLWSSGVVVNFLPGQNLTFSEITELRRYQVFWGEYFSVPVGVENPWKLLADVATLLIILYVADASLRLWRRKKRQPALYTGGAILFFIIAAGVHSPLVDAGVVMSPYLISFAFLAIVATMSYQLVQDAIQARKYAKELQKTRQTLNQISRSNMIGEYTTMLAHELNQPLTAILSNAQAARRYLNAEDPDLAEIHEILDDIVRDDKRAGDIIHHLRRMVQKEETIREPFDLNTAVREVIEILSRDISSNGIKLDSRLCSDLPKVWAGKIEVQQVVLNFLTNAIKAVVENPADEKLIAISTLIQEGGVQVEVADTGSGISDEIETDIFNHFVSDSDDGMGLGLAISRRIIENYGGDIGAQNRQEGGALFSFSLPAGSIPRNQ